MSPTSTNSTPDAPVPDGESRRAQDQDVPANSSDSESSFSDWHSSPLSYHKTSCQGNVLLFRASIAGTERDVGGKYMCLKQENTAGVIVIFTSRSQKVSFVFLTYISLMEEKKRKFSGSIC